MRVESMFACVLAAILAAAVVASSAAAGATPQTLVVITPAPATATYDTAFTVAADSRKNPSDPTSQTGLAVTYSASGSCTNAGTGASNRIQMTSGTGTCTVQFSQAGDATYAPAQPIVETVTATKADQEITFGSLQSATYKDPNFEVSAIVSSDLDPVFSATGSCTVKGTTVHLTGGGACTITASQPGNANFNAATPVSQTFKVARASQVITFFGIDDRRLGSRDFFLHAKSDSHLPVSYTAKGACRVKGSRVHLTRVGKCTITASQPGNANYKPAKNQTQSFVVGKRR